MKYKVDFQDEVKQHTPNIFHIQRWVTATLEDELDKAVVSIRVVNEAQMQALNKQYRGKNKPTNVLSFPSDLPEEVLRKTHQLGDIVLCSDVIEKEAAQQGKASEAHWAHMIVHGLLHLLDYDHIEDDDAQEMEALETEILTNLGFENPYENDDDD